MIAIGPDLVEVRVCFVLGSNDEPYDGCSRYGCLQCGDTKFGLLVSLGRIYR